MIKVFLEEMSWVEISKLLPSVKVALVPVGSTEQHGPPLPMCVDTISALAVAKRVAEKMYPSVIVAPIMPVGVSFHHMRFAGSLSIRESTMIDYAYDIAASFKHYGIDFVFFLNGHWGNKTALAYATAKIRRELGIKALYLCYWDLYPQDKVSLIEDGEIPDHAGEFEASLTLHLRGDLVRKDFKRTQDAFTVDRKMYELLLTADDQFPLFGLSRDGIFYGNPAKATAEKGEKIIEYVSDEIVKFLNNLLKTYKEPQKYLSMAPET